jgi:hypothetical protein
MLLVFFFTSKGPAIVTYNGTKLCLTFAGSSYSSFKIAILFDISATGYILITLLLGILIQSDVRYIVISFPFNQSILQGIL